MPAQSPAARALDDALLAACQRGDRGALETVFRAHAPALTRLITRLVGNSSEVEDLLQATFLAAIPAFRRFRGEASVATWLSRIAVHVVHGYWRSPERKRRVPWQTDSAPDDLAPRADRIADARRQLARVYDHLGRISTKKRMAFILHVIDGRPMDEVAALTGASLAATRSRVFWARRALKARAAKDPLLRPMISDPEETV